MDIPRAIVEIFQQIKERLQITVVCSIEDMVAFISWMALCAKINEGHSETSFSLEAKPQRSHCVLLVNNGVRFRRGSRDETRRPGTLLFFSSFLLLFLLFGHFLHLFRSFFLFLFYGIPNDAVAFASVRSPPTAPNFPSFHLFLYIPCSTSLCSNTFTLLFYWFIFVSFWVSLTATTSFFCSTDSFSFHFFLLYCCISNFSSHHILLLYSLFAFAFFS